MIEVNQKENSTILKFDLNSSMKKNLKSQEVLSELQKKVELKIALRDAKREHDEEKISVLSKKIDKIDTKLSSTPLQKI